MDKSLTPTQELMQKISGTHWLDNNYVSGNGSRTAITDPATALQCGEFAHATNTEIDSAVRNANRAQREWWSMSALDRANALHSVADKMLAMTATTGEVLTREMGKPFLKAIGKVALRHLRFATTPKLRATTKDE